MVVIRRKKVTKYRGSQTHGCGSMKKRRGAGNRGGRGRAGTGKKADQNKPSYWKSRYFGKHGFKKKGIIKKTVAINLMDIEEHLEQLLEKKLISKENDAYIIDGKKAGFTKVLGTGTVTKKLRITADEFSANAKEKIEKAGGEATSKNVNNK